MKNYERLIIRRNPKTVDLIQEQAHIKLHSRVSRLHENQVPLLRTLLFKLDSKQRNKRCNAHHSKQASATWDESFIPHRGPLVDIHGPGTVFYYIRQREQARRRAIHKVERYRNTRVGFALHSIVQTNTAHDPSLEHPHMVTQSVLPDFTFSESAPQGNMSRPHTTPSTASWIDNSFFATSPHITATRNQSRAAADHKHVRIGKDCFCDHITSDQALSDLEQRIKDWHTDIYQLGERPQTVKPQAFKMRRVENEVKI